MAPEPFYSVIPQSPTLAFSLSPDPTRIPTPFMQDQGYKRHPDFYFVDGSVILRISNTLFRVHQSILARHSLVFRDLWEIPQPPGVESIDGCPAVDLQDELDDFTDTMRAIYDSFYFDSIDLSTVGLGDLLTFISGILRISTKYSMAQLRKKCISILRLKFPNTFESCSSLLQTQSTYTPKDIVRLIPLARQTNVPEVLPWAYYLCTHMPVDDIVKSPVLSWEDKTRILAGKEKLWQAQTNTAHSVWFQFTVSPQCTLSCGNKLQASFPVASSPINPGATISVGRPWKEVEPFRESPHPLQEYDGWTALKHLVCSKCFNLQISLHKKGREEVWNRLPTYFALGSWSEITRDQGLSS